MIAAEEWRAVVGHESVCEVSSFGRVRSLDRVRSSINRYGAFTFRKKGALLKQRPDRDGYMLVGINDYGLFVRRVHHLVLEAFVGPRPLWAQTRHLNGVRSENYLGNLAWGTGVEQCDDKVLHGTLSRLKGEANGAAKLTTSDVIGIRAGWLGAHTQATLATMFGVSQSNVSIIVNRKAWAHV